VTAILALSDDREVRLAMAASARETIGS
jgi:hypothetical protein